MYHGLCWRTSHLKQAVFRLAFDVCRFASRVTHVAKAQIDLRKEELEALRDAARPGRSVSKLARDAIRQALLVPADEGPVAIWHGQPKRGSIDHDGY